MKRFVLLAALVLACPAQAADKVLMLSDPEQAAYRAILDAAIRASGLSQISRNAIILSDKLDAAGTLTEPKAEPPKAPADPPKKEGEEQ